MRTVSRRIATEVSTFPDWCLDVQSILGPLLASLSGSPLLSFVDSIPGYAASPDFSDAFPSEV
ncbi:hypothetical protein M427DRAFT_161178, partial [Gonapodya prolifera JEL478]